MLTGKSVGICEKGGEVSYTADMGVKLDGVMVIVVEWIVARIEIQYNPNYQEKEEDFNGGLSHALIFHQAGTISEAAAEHPNLFLGGLFVSPTLSHDSQNFVHADCSFPILFAF